VLDEVQRRRFLVEPAGEDPLPPPLRVPDAELDEGAGQLLNLPRRCGLAGAQAHRRIADPNRLAGLEGEVAGDAVALVEEAEHRHALGHRSRAGRDRGDGLRDVDGAGLARGLTVGPRLIRCAPVAAGERGEGEQGGAELEPHALSGVQAS